MTPPDTASVRRSAGLFRLPDRVVLRVRGADRVRWLNGMLTNDVSNLSPGPERSGCHALLLTHQGRVVADFHVLWREAELWLETAASALLPVRERLGRFIVADAVELSEPTPALARLALEGPGAASYLARVTGVRPELSPGSCADVTIAGAGAVVARYGFSGEDAYQLFVAGDHVESVFQALAEAGGDDLVLADEVLLEVLRIEAGLPRIGAELDESVLPSEARLDAAVSTTKGCYTGQEVVARIASQGRVKHLLVGLQAQGAEAIEVGGAVFADEKRVGEVTSSCFSPDAGAIALAFVRRTHEAPGTELRVGERAVRVTTLPFVAPRS